MTAYFRHIYLRDRFRIHAVALSFSVLALAGGYPFLAEAKGTSQPSAAAQTAPPGPTTDDSTNVPSVPKDGQVPNLPGMQVFQGSGSFINPVPGQASSDVSGNVTLDFSDVDIRDVVRTIFSDILKISYTIDPKVTGHITLKTGRPIPKEEVLPALETALNISGAAITRTGDIYNIVPITDAQSHGQIVFGSNEAQEAGYGIEIVPLQYVSAEEMQRVIKPLVPKGAIVQIDTQRNLIFLAGTEPERTAIRQTIDRFDVNYLKGMSFALIQPKHADANTLATELDKIFDESNSPIAGLVRLVPISRINSLLVITQRPTYLREVQRWVARLDIVPVTPNRKLYYYRLQNAQAHDVAEILGKLFGTGGDETPSPAANGLPMANSFSAMGNSTSFQPASNSNGPGFSSSPFGTSPQSPQNMIGPPSSTSHQDASNSHGKTTPGSPQIVTDEANNALIIRADARDYAAIEEVIKKMDVPPSQVLVEATIVEVTLNDALQYGVEWSIKNGTQTYVASPDGNVTPQFPGLGATYTVPNVNVALSALGALTKITVLSSPKILTLDNKTATIEVGDQIPIVTQTSVGTVTDNAPIVSSIQQRNTGVILSVTPRIGESGVVYLDVSQEVSSSTPTTSSNIDSPTIQERRIQTTVAINSGATIALGGLIQRNENVGDSGIPFLKDIPLLGGLFSTKSNSRGRTELLVFLTPQVIRNLPAALDATSRLEKNMEDVRAAMDKLKKQPLPRRPW